MSQHRAMSTKHGLSRCETFRLTEKFLRLFVLVFFVCAKLDQQLAVNEDMLYLNYISKWRAN